MADVTTEGLKHALDSAGYAGGRVRAPLKHPSEEAQREIAQLLSDALRYASEAAAPQAAAGADNLSAGANR